MGSEAVSAQLRVLEMAPSFAKYPMLPVESVVGGNAVLTCQPEGAPLPKTAWQFNGAPISTSPSTMNVNTGTFECAGTYCTLPNGNLFIYQVQQSAAGIYSCLAENTFGQVTTSALLTVMPALTWLLQPENRVVQLNQSVQLPCRAQGDPHLDINYAWKFEVG
ncbi:unnamed protein product [Protopolystoma xenopodis]|uniref:Ig-like domain-containing protein n=1 Tax=Protopolystoma xenopodis TaxID=117903 RepID=A0A448XCD8_9PLAT|nr:unnamed protein product [Protopolystoma xenopodis]